VLKQQSLFIALTSKTKLFTAYSHQVYDGVATDLWRAFEIPRQMLTIQEIFRDSL